MSQDHRVSLILQNMMPHDEAHQPNLCFFVRHEGIVVYHGVSSPGVSQETLFTTVVYRLWRFRSGAPEPSLVYKASLECEAPVYNS